MTTPRSVRVVTPSAQHPISLADAKAYLRVTSTDDDSLISDLIHAALDTAQQYTRRYFMNTTLLLTMEGFGAVNDFDLRLGEGVHEGAKSFYNAQSNVIDLPHPIIQSITSIVTYNPANISATFSASKYRLDGQTGRVYLNTGETFPTDLRDYAAVEITYVSGFGSLASNVPASIRQALLSMVATSYECRTACEVSGNSKTLLTPYKLYDMGGWQ